MEADYTRSPGHRFFGRIEQLHRMLCTQGMSLKLNPGELIMLLQIERFLELHPDCPGPTPSQLTMEGHISKPAVSKMIGTLEEKGYLIRTASRQDRRVVYINLTELGKKNLETERKHRDEDMERIVKRMGAERMEQLFGLLDELVLCAREELFRAGEKRGADQGRRLDDRIDQDRHTGTD